MDFDDEETYNAWHADFAETFDRTVMAKTRKGFHVWLKRTPLCDALGLRDGPVGTLPGPDGKLIKLPMDIKTYTNSVSMVPDPDDPTKKIKYFTPGFCAVYPSPNKTWIRSPFEHPMLDVPDALAQRLLTQRGGTAEPLGGEVKRKREFTATTVAPGGSKAFWRACDLDVPCLVKMGFPKSKMLAMYEYGATKTRSDGGYVGDTVFQFQLQKGVACPLCGKGEGHDNSYWVAHLPDGSRRVKSMSPVCFPHYHHANGKTYPGKYKCSVELPWSDEGRAGWLAAMRARSRPAPEPLMETIRGAYGPSHPFGNASKGFIFESRKLVFHCIDGLCVVLFGPGDQTVAWPTASITGEPWLDKMPATAVPLVGVAIDAFRELSVY